MKPLILGVVSAGIAVLGTGIVIDQNFLAALGAIVTILSGFFGILYAQRASMARTTNNFADTINDFMEVVTKDNANLRESLVAAQSAILESDRQRNELRLELLAARDEIAEATRINTELSIQFAQVKKSLEDCLQFRQSLEKK